MNPRTIAIGDIHGCDTALQTLLEAIDPQPSDVIISLGDLIDRGPSSNAAVQRLIDLGQHCTVKIVMGNHEEMLLDVLDGSPHQGWLRHGGVATLDSYGFDGNLDCIPKEHIKIMRSALAYFETDTHLFIHANYEPNLPMEEQPIEVLRWRHLSEITPGPHVSGKKAIVGHTPDFSGEVFDIGHLACIDTYAYGGGWLTALDVGSGQIWKANQEGELDTK